VPFLLSLKGLTSVNMRSHLRITNMLRFGIAVASFTGIIMPVNEVMGSPFSLQTIMVTPGPVGPDLNALVNSLGPRGHG
jgi:hypothetical protein